MPTEPGDLLPTSGEHYAAQLDRLLLAPYEGFSEETPWWLTGLEGIGDSLGRYQLDPYALAPGGRASIDLPDCPAITCTAFCRTGLASTAELAWHDATATWAPASTDVELHLYLPGIGHKFYIGRTRPALRRMVHMADGIQTATFEFVATVPALQEPA